MKSRDHLVLVETHQLGDAILSLPFLREAQKHMDVSVVCHPRQELVFNMALGREQVVSLVPPWYGGKAALSWLGKNGFPQGDVAVAVWPDFRIHWLMKQTGARKRIGFAMNEKNIYAPQIELRKKRLLIAQRLEWFLGKSLTEEVHKESLYDPPWKQWQTIASEFGWDLDLQTPWFNLPDTTLPSELAPYWDQHAGKVWVFHPGAGAPMRRWPEDQFKKLIQIYIHETNMGAVVVDDGTLNSGMHWPSGAFIWRSGTPIDFLKCVYHSRGLCCNDSFPAHAGAALGKRVATIFTDQEPAIFAPYANHQWVVSTNVCKFRPCLDQCLQPSYMCRDTVSVDMVWQTLRNALDQ